MFPLDVFEKLTESAEFVPPSKLVALLQHLNIRKDFASSQYFIPCVFAHSELSKSTGTSLSLVLALCWSPSRVDTVPCLGQWWFTYSRTN